MSPYPHLGLTRLESLAYNVFPGWEYASQSFTPEDIPWPMNSINFVYCYGTQFEFRGVIDDLADKTLPASFEGLTLEGLTSGHTVSTSGLTLLYEDQQVFSAYPDYRQDVYQFPTPTGDTRLIHARIGGGFVENGRVLLLAVGNYTHVRSADSNTTFEFTIGGLTKSASHAHDEATVAASIANQIQTETSGDYEFVTAWEGGSGRLLLRATEPGKSISATLSTSGIGAGYWQNGNGSIQAGLGTISSFDDTEGFERSSEIVHLT